MSTTSTDARLSERVTEEVRAVLARRRVSATELARRMGVTQSYLARRMTGVQPLDLNDLDKIALALEIEAIDLLRAALTAPTLTFRDPSMARVVDHLRHRHGAPSGGRPSNRADRNGSPTRLRDASFVPRRLAA